MRKRHLLLFLVTLHVLFIDLTYATEPISQDNEQDAVPVINRQSQTMVIAIQGKISKNLLTSIIKITQKLPLEDKFPPYLMVLLDSNGGDGEAAIEIGKLLRKFNAHVFVTNRCGSACVFVYAGGVFRASLPSSIGIHQPRVTLSDSGARIIKELDTSKNETAQNMLTSFDSKADDYFNRMGITPGFYNRIQSQKTKELHWLDEKELEKYKINGFSEEYLDILIRNINGRMTHPMDRDRVIMNSLNVLKECSYWKNEPSNFTKCYMSTILKD